MSYPTKFWHVRWGSAILNDLTLAQILDKVVTPYREGRGIIVGGQTLQPDDDIRIVRTANPLAFYVNKFKKKTGLTGDTWSVLKGRALVNEQALPFNGDSTDHTQELLSEDHQQETDNDATIVVNACLRFRETARVLTTRKNNPYVIAEEADVRDLLDATLRAYCDGIVPEEHIAKIAGSSSRADIAVEHIGVAIEIKLVRGNGSQSEQKDILTSLSEKLSRYARWPHLRTLVYVVYNSDKLYDPPGLRLGLEGEKVLAGQRFNVVVALV